MANLSLIVDFTLGRLRTYAHLRHGSSMEADMEDVEEFVRFAGKWRGIDEAVGEHLNQLVFRIGVLVEIACGQLRNGGTRKARRAFQVNLRRKIKLIKLRIDYAKEFASTGRLFVRKKEDPIDFALEIISKKYHKLQFENAWKYVVDRLTLLQTFLKVFRDSGDTKLGDIVSSIEGAFKSSGQDIDNAIQNVDNDDLYSLRSSLVKDIDILMSRIRETYKFLSDNAFEINTTLSSIGLDRFCDLLVSTVMDFLFSSGNNATSWDDATIFAFYTIVETLRYFGNHTSDFDKRKQTKELYSLMQGGAICLARVVFLWCGGETQQKDAIIMISDVLQRIKPTSPEILDLYLIDLSAVEYISKFDLVRLVDMILPCHKRSLKTLRDRLNSQLEYLVHTYSTQPKDTELLRSDVEKVFCEAASLSYSFYRALAAHHKDSEKVLHLLRKIKFLEGDIGLRRLITGTLDKVSTGFIKSISSVRTLLNCSDKSAFIFERIEQVAREAEYMHLSLQPVAHRDALKFILFLHMKLLKIHIFFTEQMGCSPSWMEETIHKLNQGLLLILKYSSLLPLENEGYEEHVFAFIQSLAKQETPPYYFPLSDQLPQYISNQMSSFLSTLLQKVNIMSSEIQDIAFEFRRSLPKTHQGLGFVDFFLEKLRRLMVYKVDEIWDSMKHKLEILLNELHSLKSNPLMKKVGETRKKDLELMNIRGLIIQAAYEADCIIDCNLLVKRDWKHMFWLSVVIDEVKVLNYKLTNFVRMKNDSGDVQLASQEMIMAQTSGALDVGEYVVSLEDQENTIVDRLVRGLNRKREVVTITGMAGIGKTTLAKKVYDHPRIKNHFHRLAWCCVSQVYRIRELLLKILSDVTESNMDEMDKKTDDELLDSLYKGLKGKRYLVVMDDVWSIQVWEELGFAFPDDKNGSRMLLTTRNEEVGLNAESNDVPHALRFLSEEESWKLLREKVFRDDECPNDLLKVGMEIAKGCKGLPMAIIAISGLLKAPKKDVELWKQIEKELNSRILESPEVQCMHILELSYNHLPDFLKPCFLYFAAFGEDIEVSVPKLIQLWIVEGFVGEFHDQKASQEDVAKSYVINLIGRSLVMAAKKGSSGKVKACKVHDMVYNLCARKVEKENFLQYINGYEKLFPSSNNQLDYGVDSDYPPTSIVYEQHRLSICSKRKHFVTLKPSGPSVRTLLYSASSDTYPRCPCDEISYITSKFRILSILDIESINIGSTFPVGMDMLYPLRYLAISGDLKSIPSGVSKLWNLEIFIVKGLRGKVVLPDTLWSMSRLRHLHVTTQAILNLLGESIESSPQLVNMVSLSCPALFHGDNTVQMMKLFPKLQKLRCTFSEAAQHSKESICFPVLDFLVDLESLKIFYYGSLRLHCHLKGVMFPVNLKKLSLSDFIFTWDGFSTIGKLPHLIILKLVSISFDSPVWEMKEDEFQQLEYLKLDSLKLVEWNAESDHLPNLKQLVLRSCIRLKEVPSSFGYVPTLQMIELKWCSVSAEKSVAPILELQLEYGNNGMKAFVNGLSCTHVESFNSSKDAQVSVEVLTLQQENEQLAKAVLAGQQALKMMKQENEALHQKLKDQGESLWIEKCAREKSDKELELMRSEKL